MVDVTDRSWIVDTVGAELFEKLAARLSGSELQSVLLDVMQRRPADQRGARRPPARSGAGLRGARASAGRTARDVLGGGAHASEPGLVGAAVHRDRVGPYERARARVRAPTAPQSDRRRPPVHEP